MYKKLLCIAFSICSMASHASAGPAPLPDNQLTLLDSSRAIIDDEKGIYFVPYVSDPSKGMVWFTKDTLVIDSIKDDKKVEDLRVATFSEVPQALQSNDWQDFKTKHGISADLILSQYLYDSTPCSITTDAEAIFSADRFTKPSIGSQSGVDVRCRGTLKFYKDQESNFKSLAEKNLLLKSDASFEICGPESKVLQIGRVLEKMVAEKALTFDQISGVYSGDQIAFVYYSSEILWKQPELFGVKDVSFDAYLDFLKSIKMQQSEIGKVKFTVVRDPFTICKRQQIPVAISHTELN